VTEKDHELRRLKKLRGLKSELIEMLGGDKPNYVQESIMKNLDERITNKEIQINAL